MLQRVAIALGRAGARRATVTPAAPPSFDRRSGAECTVAQARAAAVGRRRCPPPLDPRRFGCVERRWLAVSEQPELPHVDLQQLLAHGHEVFAPVCAVLAGLPVGVVAGADASVTSIPFLGRYASGYQSMRVHGKNKK